MAGMGLRRWLCEGIVVQEGANILLSPVVQMATLALNIKGNQERRDRPDFELRLDYLISWLTTYVVMCNLVMQNCNPGLCRQ